MKSANLAQHRPQVSGSSNLLRAKLTVQENVREIIQLLNSPNIASQLEGFGDKSNLSHDMEKLNFNTVRNKGPTDGVFV